MPKSRKGNRAWRRMLPVALRVSTTLVLGLPGVALASPGDLDISFNTDGWATTLVVPNSSAGPSAAAQAVAIQANGGIVLAGQVGPESTNSFGLARYEPNNGTLDPSFDGDGKLLTSFGQFDGARSVAIDPVTQDIVAVGYTSDGFTLKFALARYLSDGSPDPNFGPAPGGKVTTSIGLGAQASAVAIQSNGRIVVAGTALFGSHARFVVARYLADGSLDTGFGANGTPPGTVTTSIGPDSQAFSVAIQPIDQYIVAAGSTNTAGTSKFALARYTTTGSLDTTGFGANSTPPGTVTTAFGSPSVADAFSVAIQGSGDIVAAGSRYNGSNNRFAVANYLSDGSLDTSFGTPQTGKVTTALGSFSSATSMAFQPVDGKIVVAGYGTLSGLPVLALCRYNDVTGVRDQSFGNNGKVRTPIGTADAYAMSLAIEPVNGQLVVGGQAFTGGRYRFAVARFDDA